MRAELLRLGWMGTVLTCAALMTGCASLPSPSVNLSSAPREADEAALEPPPSEEPSRALASPPPAILKPEGPERRHRRRGARVALRWAVPGGGVAAVGGSATRGTVQEDAWEQLLTSAGLEKGDERPVPGSPLTPTQAARLMEVLLTKPVTLGTYPPRMAVGHLLRQVLETGEVSRKELLRRVERFSHVAVLRPDGYLAWVRSGRTQQRVAPVEWKEGAFRARQFELGRFYVSNGYLWRLADERLEPVANGPVAVEVYDDADYLSRSLDGAEAAFVKLALGLGQLFTHPVDSLAGLRELPAGVVALIASSPEYLERFRAMTRGEQARAVAELATTLLVTKGSATRATRTVTGALAGAEATVPVLSLSAQGALSIERVAVPVGRAATVLGGGPGAAVLLHRANTATGESSPSGGRGPGQWGPAEEGGMSKPARAYQEQITGHSADEAYWVGGVGKKNGGTKFDGFKDGVCLEAKGPNYANKFQDNLDPEPWFRDSGAEELVKQARRQSERVQGMGIPIEWHVAEKKAADAIRLLLQEAQVEGIKVIHTPAL